MDRLGSVGGALAALVLTLTLGAGLVPGGSATSPSPPWEISALMHGEPRIGQEVDLTLTARFNSPENITWTPLFPAWIEGDRSPWRMQGGEGDAVSHTWTLTPTQAGFWGFQLASDMGSGWCCIYAYSSTTEGRTGNAWEHGGLFPPAKIEATHDIVVSGGTTTATYTVKAAAPWMRHGELVVTGSSNGRDEGSVRIPHGETRTLEIPLQVPPGGNAVASFFVEWRGDPVGNGFPEHGLGLHIECINVEAAVREGKVVDGESWSCDTAASLDRWEMFAPGPGAFAVVIPVALAALCIRQREL